MMKKQSVKLARRGESGITRYMNPSELQEFVHMYVPKNLEDIELCIRLCV